MKGAWARRARRRASSDLPTPVGPIIRMFFGVTSWRRSSGSCSRRQRLRRAMATTRLASCWPMIWRSSSWTLSRGVMDMWFLLAASGIGVQLLNGLILVGVDADLASDTQAGFDYLPGRQIAVPQQGAGR